MDLRQLTTFVQAADLGSLSKAAERLRIAQPALNAHGHPFVWGQRRRHRPHRRPGVALLP